MEEDRRNRITTGSFDYILLMIVFLLCVFGLAMIYSSSYYNAEHFYDDSTKYFLGQLKALLVGVIAAFVVMLINISFYHRRPKWLFKIEPVWLIYIACVVMQSIVLVKGYTAGGSARWIKIGPLQFQPSELSKISVILLSAYLVSCIEKRKTYWQQKVKHRTIKPKTKKEKFIALIENARAKGMDSILEFLVVAVINAPLLVLVAIENLSTAIIMAGIMCVICFVTTQKKLYYIPVVIAGIGLVALATFKIGYRTERVQTWLHPETADPGSQVIQSLYAIASGGMWGKGLGESTQKLGYIQEVHTDMIFSVVCEELGIFGAILLIAVYLMLIWRLYMIARNAPDMFGCLVATGIMTHVAMQVVLHIAVVTGTIPATGISLPFVSYGGTAILALMIEMGLALSISRRTPKKED